MRSYQLLFAILLLLCGVVLYAAILDEVPSQRGLPHPDFATMQLGGDGEARHGQILWLGYAFGALVIALFVGLIDAALVRGGKPGPPAARRTVWVIGAVIELVFLMLILAYRSYMADPHQAIFLGFPKPTAWMMYGIWGVPTLFVLFYILRFEQWVLDPAAEAEFAALEAQKDGERAEELARERAAGGKA